MRIMMVVASGGLLLDQRGDRQGALRNADKMNFEAPLTSLVWLTSIVSVGVTFVVSYLLIPDLGDGTAVVEALDDHHLRHAGRRDHPRAGQGLHLDRVGATCARS